MKQIFTLLMLGVVSMSALFAQTKYNTAGDYMTAISTESRKITEAFVFYSSEVAHSKKAKAVEKSRQELINSVVMAEKRVLAMPAWKGNTAYRDSIGALFTMYRHILKEDYDQILDLEAIAEESYDAMEAYFRAQDLASEKSAKAAESAEFAEIDFANEFDVNLIQSEDKLSKKAKIASEVMSYQRDIYLIFFKSYKQEVYLMDALKAKDVSAIEQNLSSMKAIANEGLKALAAKPDYKADKTLKEACKAFLNHAIKESAADFTSFIIEGEKMAEAEKTFKAIKKPSQDEVNTFNAAVKAYNEAVNASNKSNTLWSNERNKALNTWNNASQGFIAKYVPRHQK